MVPRLKRKPVAALLFGAVPLFLLAVPACDTPRAPPPARKEGRTPQEGPEKDHYEIVVIPKGTTHEFWRSIHAGARKAEREINAAGEVSVQVIWRGPLKEDDRKHQIDLVQTFISRGVDGIVLAPLDQDALVRPVSDAMAAGIAVVIIDSGLTGKPGKDFVSYIATDNYKGGVLGARRLGGALGGKGDVILLRCRAGSESTTQRERGFLDTMAEEFPEIRIISSDQYAGATTETSKRKSQELLARFENEVDGIFTPNEVSCFGMLRALKDRGLAGKIRFVGFDASEALVRAVEEGDIDGLVLQNPVRMGYDGMKAMVKHLRGESVEPLIDTGAVVVTKENINRPEMRELHSPDLSRWLEN